MSKTGTTIWPDIEIDSHKMAMENIKRTLDYYNIRLMPHGGIILFPTVLSTMALCASFADDGCDYAKLSGAAVSMLVNHPRAAGIPYLHVGMAAYRIPGYYPTNNEWRVVYSDSCVPYKYMDILADSSWKSAEWLKFFALVVGGTMTLFLWSSTFLILRINYWKACGIGLGVACLFQLCSLVWFYTKLCHGNSTTYHDFEAGVSQNIDVTTLNDDTECTLFFGSRCAITSTVLWGLACALILLREYPHPVSKYVLMEDKVVPSLSSKSSGGSLGEVTKKKRNDHSFRSAATESTTQSYEHADNNHNGRRRPVAVRQTSNLGGSMTSGITFA